MIGLPSMKYLKVTRTGLALFDADGFVTAWTLIVASWLVNLLALLPGP